MGDNGDDVGEGGSSVGVAGGSPPGANSTATWASLSASVGGAVGGNGLDVGSTGGVSVAATMVGSGGSETVAPKTPQPVSSSVIKMGSEKRVFKLRGANKIDILL